MSDAIVSADIYSSNPNYPSILLVRSQDSDNYLSVEIDNSGLINVNRRLNAVNTNIGTKTVVYSSGKTLKVECNGSTLKVYYDNVLQLTITETNLLTNTKHGIALWSTIDSYIDNFKVRSKD